MAHGESLGSGAGGLLSGLRVVEVTHGLAVPLVGMALAEQGAEVVRIVDPRRPPADPVLDALTARGKTEVSLDLGSAAGREAVRRLVARADVLIEDGPGLALDLEGLRATVNPGLVSCAIASFEAADPRRDTPDHEAVVGALGYLYERPIGPPRYHEFPIASVMAGLFAMNGIVAALIARLRLGRGQRVEVSRFGASLFAQILQALVKTGVPRGFLPFRMFGTPFMRSWLCGDGRYIYLHITLPAHNARILDRLEELGYVKEVGEIRAVLSPETARDPSKVKSIAEAKELRLRFERVFQARPAAEWEALLGQELCCIKVRKVDEWLDDALAAGMHDASAIEDPTFGPLTAPGPVVTCREMPPILKPRTIDPAAFDALARRWDDAPPPLAVAVPSGPVPTLRHPLEGLRVLDLSRIIAGPCAARVLAELGAEVLSVQSPTGLDWALSFHLMFNAGKRSVTLDFTTEEGKATLWRILDEQQPHAFLQNYRHLDVARAVGVHPEAVRARFPSIVYTHLNAYGNDGIWRDRPGFEQVVQAVSGIQLAYGRGGPPKLLPTPVIDIGCGLLGAFGTLLGLYHQQRTGEGSFSATHLTRVSVLFQLPSIAASQRDRALASARAAGHPIDFDAASLVQGGIVRALDAFVCVAGPRRDLEAFLRREGVLAPGAPAPEDLVGALGRRLWALSAAAWRARLEAAGLAATVALIEVPKLGRVVEEVGAFDASPLPLVRRRAFSGCRAPLTFLRNPLALSVTPLSDIAPPPTRGEHTREVLARLGQPVGPGAGVIPYPGDKPLLTWLSELVRWGYFAWRSGNL